MSRFYLSNTSLRRLDGVDERLSEVVHRAITITEIDFGVTCGLRTNEEQHALYARGATKTLRSKHLSGDAVDVVAYLGRRISWELSLYDEIADAFRIAATREGLSLRWGGAWTVRDIRQWDGTMEEAMNSYIDTRRSQHRRPFIDAPHFEIS